MDETKTRSFPLSIVGVAVFFCGCFDDPVRVELFEKVHRAAKAVEGSAGIGGVNYAEMEELLKTFSTELLIAKENSESETELKIIQSYSEALQIYQDSLIVWQLQIKTTSDVAPQIVKRLEINDSINFADSDDVRKFIESVSDDIRNKKDIRNRDFADSEFADSARKLLGSPKVELMKQCHELYSNVLEQINQGYMPAYQSTEPLNPNSEAAMQVRLAIDIFLKGNDIAMLEAISKRRLISSEVLVGWHFISNNSVQQLWENARMKVNEARELYK